MGLLALLLGVLVSVSICQDKSGDKAAKRTEKVKANIAKLGTGPGAKVQATLGTGTKIMGYISRIENDSFFVTGKSGDVTEIKYADVEKVAGGNMSTGKKIAIGFGIGVAAYAILVLIALLYGGD